MTNTVPDVSTPAGIIRLCNAFCDAKALLTAAELDLFTVLHAGPLTEEEIRLRLELHGRGLRDFLQLLVALGLVEKQDGHYRNAPGADRYLVRHMPTYVGGFLHRANNNLYPAWGRLTEALRTGKPQAAGDFEQVLRNPEVLGQFVRMMDALTQVLGPRLIEAFDWTGYRTVLDVGGCRGNMAGQIVKAHPGLTGHVLDLPQMEPFFDEHMAALGLTGEVRFHGGNFFHDPLPRADLVILGHVLHDFDQEHRKTLVHRACEAVLPGGALLVYDRMLDEEPTHVENLVISLDMLLVSDGGSEYPAGEIREHAAGAGFTRFHAEPLGDYDTLVVCRRP
ncbi:methyltransferase [Kibdelosporangium persicum]|uniref:Tetracenomycin polyketide synthesis 8-O-methyl transferase TcmO n=1 Tax=Kibdelosporangium persicum TaxID=2698649 RepID=A0ABX2FHY1_9PSEU|nr:methyltransferase [Kibdelosporangium persicum]NRN71014.1 Tetracenomycin polyketide synthesis 8-O-methyl transferase TcmO [Kibdelosporangium persicum]